MERQSTTDRRGFTLVEMLITVTVITILAGASMGGIYYAREMARESRTKATIAKLNNVIMERYESYRTRRVAMSLKQNAPRPTSKELAQARLDALRDLMRMEMPDRWNDVTDPPAKFSWGEVADPGLRQVYGAIYSAARGNQQSVGANSAAECLYLIVSVGSPEAMEQFHQTEIGDVDNDGLPEFLDAWGHPIYFLRWAPGYSSTLGGPSGIQSGDATNDHDPFDAHGVDPDAFKLVPLIYSGGRDGKYYPDSSGNNAWNFDINTGQNVHFGFGSAGNNATYLEGDPYSPAGLEIGRPIDAHGDGDNSSDNITNHLIDAR